MQVFFAGISDPDYVEKRKKEIKRASGSKARLGNKKRKFGQVFSYVDTSGTKCITEREAASLRCFEVSSSNVFSVCSFYFVLWCADRATTELRLPMRLPSQLHRRFTHAT